MNTIINRAKAHFDQPLRHIDVPEWGDGKQPLRIYAKASLSVHGRRRCWHDGNGKTFDGSMACLRAVMLHALDKSGEPLFSEMDEHALTYEVDSDVVARIGAFILGFVSGSPKPASDQVNDSKKA